MMMRQPIRLVLSIFYLEALIGPIAATRGTRQITARPDVIVLEGGATTFVSSLDEHLVAQTEASSQPTSSAVIFKIPDGRQSKQEGANESRAVPDRHDQPRQQVRPHLATPVNQSQKPIPQHWQVKSLLNVTHDYPLAYSQIICGYVWPLMAALTLFTNLMIVFVLTQRDMRTPTNVVLTSIAIADIIPIVVPVPWFVYLFAMGNEKQVLYPPVVCYFYQHSTRSVSEIFYFVSTWLNVLLAVQDYLVACRPKLAQKYCQIRVVVVEIVLLTLLAFLLNLPQALKLVFKPVKFYFNGQLTWGCKAMQARWFKDWVGEHVALYDDIFTAIIVLLVDGGPAVVLITLTALLIRQLHRQRIQGHILMEQARTASKRRRERHRQQESEASARVMIFVLLAFLAVKIPFATTYTLMIIQSRFEIHFVENLVDFQKAITLTDLIFVLSYPLNFTIFCCCSKKFRHKCAQLLSECNHSTKATRDAFMSSFNSESSIRRRLSSLTSIGTTSRTEPRGSLGYAGQKFRARDSTCSAANGLVRPIEVAVQPQPLPWPDAKRTISTVEADRCASQHHKQEQPSDHEANSIPTSPQLRALLESGDLCLECVVYYERVRRACSISEISSLVAQPRIEPVPQVGGDSTLSPSEVSVGSNDSTARRFVLMPVPPPPPVPRSLASLLQEENSRPSSKEVPQIITTACESFGSEHPSDDSRDEAERDTKRDPVGGACDKPSMDFGAVEDPKWLQSGSETAASSADHWPTASVRRSGSRSDSEGQPQSFGRLSYSQDLSSSPAVATEAKAAAAGRIQMYVVETKAKSASDMSSGEREQPFGGAEAEKRRSDGLAMGQDEVDSESSSEPENRNERPGSRRSRRRQHKRSLENRASVSERLFGKGGRKSAADRKHETNLSLKPSDDRKRSLSLSNSNLATLPNATGMLADALVSVLFGGGGGRQNNPSKGAETS